MNVKQIVPLLHVRDMSVSTRFYIESLGFTMTNSWTPEGKLRWCWLELGETALMLQAFRTEGPHRNVPDHPVGAGVSLNFTCEDALALYREFKSRAVEMKRPFVGNGMWVVSVKDPDGYALFFQSKTDAAEESELDG